MRHTTFSNLWISLVGASLWASTATAAEQHPTHQPAFKRVPWTTSHVEGRPEPPLPYQAEPVFKNLSFAQPTVLTAAPGTDRLFVAERSGKVFSIAADPTVAEADVFVDPADLVAQLNESLPTAERVRLSSTYGLTFHPQFSKNRQCYLCYVVQYTDQTRGPHPHGSRVVRLNVTAEEPPRAVLESEREIITWKEGGHNGGCLKFGPDGMLYITTGDAAPPFPPDPDGVGQDVTNLLSAVLRINVDQSDGNRNYSIPADNPFVDHSSARGEIWAYGLRNPWKMSFDRQTGDLWVGDVGWQLWEMVYRVRPGDNFGWSLVEGPQPIHTERRIGPTPIVPPVAAIPHSEGASVTGGFVYRGKRHPDLFGKYICGDWETRRIWSIDTEGKTFGRPVEVVEPTVRIVGFAERHDGELLLLDYDTGAILEIVPNEAAGQPSRFPRKLSDTGLFASTPDHTPAAGVIPFSINAEQWADFASSERLLALPHDLPIRVRPEKERVAGSQFSRRMDFPQGAVLAKTLSLEMVHGEPSSRRRIETQLLHFDGFEWRGYSFRWNVEQTDAELVPGSGATETLTVTDSTAPGKQRLQQWRFHSRTECLRCHNPWAESTLAFNLPQINRPHAYGSWSGNQITVLTEAGVLKPVAGTSSSTASTSAADGTVIDTAALPRLVDPHDITADLNHRGRSYLHVNCAHCHREHGGGSARIHVAIENPLRETEALRARPTQGTFGIFDAEIIAPGDPYRSVMYFRMAKAGPGHMPHLGATIIDDRGVELIHDWIQSLPLRAELADLLQQLTQSGGSTLEASTQEALIGQLLSTPPGGMLLARAVRQHELPADVVELAVKLSREHESLAVRDLFEPFLPDDQKPKRLGDVINPASLLAVVGNAERGRALFANGAGIQCRNCHRVGETGVELGPDLTHIGKKLDRVKLLESMLEPSRTIDPKYIMWLVETKQGMVVSGLLVEKNDKEVVLKDSKRQLLRLPVSDVEGMYPQQKSLMPELLLRDMSAEQVADLLTWLESLR